MFESVFDRRATAEPGDYRGEDGLLYCGKCGTRKEFRHFVEFFKRDVIAPVACDCQRAAYVASVEEQQRREQMERIAGLRKSGVGDESYRRMTFSADDGGGDRNAAQIARNFVKNWDAMRDRNVGLIFSGEPGTGKTFYAAAIANALIDMSIPSMIATVPSLATAMAADFEAKKPEILAQVKSVDLLVLDDVGIERRTSYMAERLFEIVDARYRSGKPLIVTTNLGLTEISDKKSNPLEYHRVFDRILELCQPVVVQGGSRRSGIARSKAEFARDLLIGR